MKLATRSEANYYCHEVSKRWVRRNQYSLNDRISMNVALGKLEGALKAKYRTTHHFDAIRSVVCIIADCASCGKPRTDDREVEFPLKPRPRLCRDCVANPIKVDEPKERTEDMTTLYRYYDSTGSLLYIGISCKPGKRMHQHYKSQPWSGLIAKTEFEHFEDRVAALNAEKSAIITEKPLHNVVHNGRN